MVLRLLKGETLDGLSREFDVPAQKLTKWRDTFLQGGLENLKEKPSSPIDSENHLLKQMIGEKSMEIELLYQKIDKFEAGLRPKSKRSRKFPKWSRPQLENPTVFNVYVEFGKYPEQPITRNPLERRQVYHYTPRFHSDSPDAAD